MTEVLKRYKVLKKTSLMMLIIFCLSVIVPPNVYAATNYWTEFKKAETAMKAKNYQAALLGYEKALPEFVKRSDKPNLALLYGRIAKCHAELSHFDQAAANWKLEAGMWEKLGKSQDKLIAQRKADAVTSDVRLFASRPVSEAGKKYFHNAKFEPVFGAYLGAYAENDKAVHDPYDPEKRYQDIFPVLTEKKHAAYLIYFTYGADIDSYKSHFMKAKETGTAIQLALQPKRGMKEIVDNEWLTSFISKLEGYDVPVFLRLANEMNEPSAPWFGPASEYIPKFRLFADVVHKKSENIAMVWAPAWFPPDTVDAYYPGDAYVDWVGLSMYKVPNPELDPLGKGVDRESYLKKLERIYNTYGTKKPIFISEGGISYSDIKTGKDTTSWAVYEMKKFYTYLPMLYPGVKATYWFDSTKTVENIPRSYLLSNNQTVLDAYKQGINNDFYLSDLYATALNYYKPLVPGSIVGRPELLSAYIKTVDPIVSVVEYFIDGKSVGKTKEMPYTMAIDLTPYKGKTIKMTLKAMNAKGALMTEKTFVFKVQ